MESHKKIGVIRKISLEDIVGYWYIGIDYNHKAKG